MIRARGPSRSVWKRRGARYTLAMPNDLIIADLLDRAGRSDDVAWSQLVDLVYPDLKRLARASLSGDRHATLNTTSLVHECYLRLAQALGGPRDRQHLMALAVRIMRQVLVDHSRRRLADKRGAGLKPLDIDDVSLADQRQFHRLVEIDDALSRLSQSEPRLAQVFECRYFGGLNDVDAGLVLNVSPRTVRRDWDRARELLAEMLDVSDTS